MTTFREQMAYYAKNTITGRGFPIQVLHRTEAGGVVFMRIKEIATADQVMKIDDREFATVSFGDGVYSVSASVPVDLYQASKAVSALGLGIR